MLPTPRTPWIPNHELFAVWPSANHVGCRAASAHVPYPPIENPVTYTRRGNSDLRRRQHSSRQETCGRSCLGSSRFGGQVSPTARVTSNDRGDSCGGRKALNWQNSLASAMTVGRRRTGTPMAYWLGCFGKSMIGVPSVANWTDSGLEIHHHSAVPVEFR